MVSSETFGGIDVVIFGFAMVPILFFGISGDIAIMMGILIALLAIRLTFQFMIRGKIKTGDRKVSKHLRLDSWSYNAMFLSAGGSIAIVFGFDGGLATTAMIGIPVLVVWYVLHYFIYADREKYDPYSQDIDNNEENNDVF